MTSSGRTMQKGEGSPSQRRRGAGGRILIHPRSSGRPRSGPGASEHTLPSGWFARKELESLHAV